MLPTLEAPELVFGLCSPIGTDNVQVVDLIKKELLTFYYKPHRFKVTDLMKAIKLKNYDLVETPIEKRYDAYIRYANRLREVSENPNVLAMLCCAAIRGHRRKTAKTADKYLPSTAYIFDQFKRREEVEALRQVYGKLFISVSIYSDRETRLQRLSQKISADHSGARVTAEELNAASALITRDENEEGVAHGQRLRDAFPLADLFINIDDFGSAQKVISRFFQSLFGSNRISPTRDEYGT